MKFKNVFFLFFASVLLLTGFSSCNTDSTRTLELQANTVYSKLGEELIFYVVTGNGGYEISVTDPTIVTANIDEKGIISLKPISLGKTTIKVTDSDLQVATATINVVYPYMAFGVIDVAIEIAISDSDITSEIKKEIENKPILLAEHLYNLTKKEDDPTFIAYEKWWDGSVASSGKFTLPNSEESMLLELETSDKSGVYEIENNTIGKLFYDYFKSNKIPEWPSNTSLTTKLTQDLTKVYKEKYPTAGVQRVRTVANVQVFPYRAEY